MTRTGFASLPMYDLPELREASESWWRGLSGALVAEGIDNVPDRLDRDTEFWLHWDRPDLIFSQTCGYPLTHDFAGRLTVIGTPAYDCEGCRGASYRSFLLVRADDPAVELAELRGRTAVVNSTDSQSGYSALRSAVAPLARDGRFFARVDKSGGHVDSMAHVVRGTADICAIDAVTYALIKRYRSSAVEGLRILLSGPEAPGLPYITAANVSGEMLSRFRSALRSAVEDPALAQVRAALLIAGAEVLPDTAYDRILELENQAIARGYSVVA